MVLCINFITCIIWCCFWSRFRFFLCGFNGCFLGDNFDGGYGSNCHLLRICDTAEWSFFIDSISFFRISISFCNASFWLFFGLFCCSYIGGCVSTCTMATTCIQNWVFNRIVLFVLCKILFAEFTSKIFTASSF